MKDMVPKRKPGFCTKEGGMDVELVCAPPTHHPPTTNHKLYQCEGLYCSEHLPLKKDRLCFNVYNMGILCITVRPGKGVREGGDFRF